MVFTNQQKGGGWVDGVHGGDFRISIIRRRRIPETHRIDSAFIYMRPSLVIRIDFKSITPNMQYRRSYALW